MSVDYVKRHCRDIHFRDINCAFVGYNKNKKKMHGTCIKIQQQKDFNSDYLHCFYFPGMVLLDLEQPIQNLWQERNEMNVRNSIQYRNPLR